MNNSIYKLCQNCKLLNGVERSCIYDFQRQRYFPIPETMGMIFNDSFEIDLQNLKQHYLEEEEQQVIHEYLQFLISNDLVIEIDREERLLFPELNTWWDFPAIISNCLIDANGEIPWFDITFTKQLSKLCCHHLQVRFLRPIVLKDLQSILSDIDQFSIKSVELIFPDQCYDQFRSEVIKLIQTNNKIKSIILHSANENTVIEQGTSG